MTMTVVFESYEEMMGFAGMVMGQAPSGKGTSQGPTAGITPETFTSAPIQPVQQVPVTPPGQQPVPAAPVTPPAGQAPATPPVQPIPTTAASGASAPATRWMT